MKKRGLSAIIAVVLIILLVVLAMALLWLLVSPFVENKLYSERVSSALMEEKFSISYVGEGDNDTDLEVVISRGATELMELAIENVTEYVETVVAIPTDIMLLVDLSGSMGWDVSNDCIINTINYNYPGSFCNLSSTHCTLSNCGGTWDPFSSVCINPTGSLKEKSCTYRDTFCSGTCGGVSGETFVPLEILKDSATDFVDEILTLNSGTQIALLGFSSDDGTGFPLLDFINNSIALQSEINNWEAGGMTYLYQGLEYAYGNFTGRTAQNKILIVLGDGDINDESVNDAIAYIGNFTSEDITVHTIGFGPSANTALYGGIAAASPGGDYHDSSNLSKLSEVFETITGNMVITELVGEEVSIWGVFLDITVFANGESFVHRILRDLPGSNEGRKYSIDLEDYSPGLKVEDVTKVEIYLVAVSQGAVENSVLMARYNVD